MWDPKVCAEVEKWRSPFVCGRGQALENQDADNYYALHLWHDESRTQNFVIHLNVSAALAAPVAPPVRESPQAAKRPVVSHLFTPAAAGCHWDSEGEIPWFSLPFLTAPAQTTLIRDCGRAGDRRQAWMAPDQDQRTLGPDLDLEITYMASDKKDGFQSYTGCGLGLLLLVVMLFKYHNSISSQYKEFSLVSEDPSTNGCRIN